MVQLHARVFDAHSLTPYNIFRLSAGMLKAILVIGVGSRHKRKLQLTRTNVYLMVLSIAGLLTIVFVSAPDFTARVIMRYDSPHPVHDFP